MIGKLFDFSFNHFLTKSIVRVLYGFGLVGAAGFAIATFFNVREEAGLIMGLLSIPIVFFLAAAVARVWAEIVIVAFRIAENTGEAAVQTARIANQPRQPEDLGVLG